ncbi:hypothetical protein [Lysinibacillus sp. FSL M8-0355]|uniref:hypothetical protein n=1 Tax=Lysinibacillus sp. FSL M8-0355 TaxID=2921719 RepID=UPI0030F61872
MKKNPQTEANKRWQAKNKERAKYLSARSVDELMELMLERKQLLLEMKINQDGM